MKKLASLVCAALGLVLGAACGGNVVAGQGGGHPGGDCKTSTDCPQGGTCAELTPGGYKVCLRSPNETTMCHTPMFPMDQCCTSADCKNGGKCYVSTDLGSCSGPAMASYNECVTDGCTSDAMCAGSDPAICAPAGAFGYPARECFSAYCKTDADCTAGAGGVCVPISQPCCGGPRGLGCFYPGGCAKDSDCATGQACQLDTKTGAGQCIVNVGCPV
jgi:hypothetical protein